MKRIGMLLAGLVMLLVSPLVAQVPIPDPLPAFEFAYSPTNPTTEDEVSLQVSGLWPNNCPPDGVDVSVNGTTIEISLLLPGAIDGNEPNCSPVQSAYGINVSVGPLAVGPYAVVVRVVSFTDATDTTSVGSFTVGIPAGGGDGEPNVPVRVGPGTCVVILQDCAGLSLRAGQAGIVVCCDSEDCSGRLLVSWFLNTAGVGTSEDCNDTTPRAMPPASATWVDPSQVGLGVCFDECGILQQNEERCYTLETDEGLTYILVAGSWLPDFLGEDAEFELGDRVRVQGLINLMRPTDAFFACTELDGDIFNPVITPCTPAGGDGDGCCDVQYEPGDRVRLLVDNPPDMTGRSTTGLAAGTLGTVICCNADDDEFSVFVSFDNFTGGNDMGFLCDQTPSVPYPANSGWWVSCGSIVFVSDDNGGENPCPDDNLTIGFGTNGIRLFRDPNCPTDARTFTGCVNATVITNFRARLSLRITPLASVGGTWRGAITPEVIPAGETTVTVCITAIDLNLAAIPAGQDTQVATVSIMGVPEPE